MIFGSQTVLLLPPVEISKMPIIWFDLPMELEDIAKVINLSKERVRQVRRDSIKKLKKFAKPHLLE